MGGSQSPSSQTVTNKTEVDPVTQAWRSNIMNAGGALYNQGTPAYYPGSTVVPFSNQTQSGLDTLQNYAQGGAANLGAANDANARALSGYNPGLGYANNAAAGGLYNSAAPMLLGASQTRVAPQISPFIAQNNAYGQGVANAGAQQTTAGVGALQNFASAQNPYLDQMYQQGAQQVANNVNGNFMQAGRFGANAANTQALTNGLGQLYTSIYAPAYENAQNRSLDAANSLAGISQADRSAAMSGYGQAGQMALQGGSLFGDTLANDAARRYQGASDYAGLNESGLNRQLSGAQTLGSLYSQGNADAARAQALLPSTYQYGQMPGQSMLDIGGMYENQANNVLQGDVGRYNYNANAPWQYLQQYSGLMSGLPDFSSSTSNTTGTQQTNRLMSGLGGAATGAGIASALSLTGPLGWGAAGIGGLLGLFG